MTAVSTSSGERVRGAAAGLCAALLFGASAPLAKLLMQRSGPLLLAGLLYLGAALGLWTAAGLGALAGSRPREAPLRRADLPLIGGVILCGGILGPILMLAGLARVTAVTGSLLLNLEAPATMLLAILCFREHLGRWEAAAALIIVVGAALLSSGIGGAGGAGELRADPLGSLYLCGACLSWGLDNNLTQRLSLKDPLQISRIKTLGAGACNLGLALLGGAVLPQPAMLGPALLLGVFSYGLSIVLHTYALRALGAARQAALFATAPFVGALLSLPLLGEHLGAGDAAAMGLMAAGVVLLLAAQHSHVHAHEPLEHEHLHSHDEHHQHEHCQGQPAGEPHSHRHQHGPLTHEHPHSSDLHHRHSH